MTTLTALSPAAHSMLTAIAIVSSKDERGCEVWSEADPLLPTQLFERSMTSPAQRGIASMQAQNDALTELHAAKLITSRGRSALFMRSWKPSAKGLKYLAAHGYGLVRETPTVDGLMMRCLRTGAQYLLPDYAFHINYCSTRDAVCNGAFHAWARTHEEGRDYTMTKGVAHSMTHLSDHLCGAITRHFHAYNAEGVSDHVDDRQLCQVLVDAFRVLVGCEFEWNGRLAFTHSLHAGYDPQRCRETCTSDYVLCKQDTAGGAIAYLHHDVQCEVLVDGETHTLTVMQVMAGLLDGSMVVGGEVAIVPSEKAVALLNGYIAKDAEAAEYLDALAAATQAGEVTWATRPVQAPYGKSYCSTVQHVLEGDFEGKRHSLTRVSPMKLSGWRGQYDSSVLSRAGMRLLAAIDRTSEVEITIPDYTVK